MLQEIKGLSQHDGRIFWGGQGMTSGFTFQGLRFRVKG